MTPASPSTFFVDENSRIIHPRWFLVLFAMLGIIFLAQPPEWAAATLILLIAAALAFLHPVNGIMLVGFATPFFLEVGSRPYFFVLEGMLFITLASAVIHRKQRVQGKFPLPLVFTLPLVVGIGALPLDLLAVPHEFWVRSPIELTQIFFAAHQGSTVYYFREIYNIATAVGLGYITWAFWPRTGDLAIRWYETFVALAVIVAMIGLALYFEIVPRGSRFLFVSLVGQQGGGITAFAYNIAFFVQCISLGLVMATLLALFGDRPLPFRVLFGVTALFLFAVMTPALLRIVPVIGGLVLLYAALSALITKARTVAVSLITFGAVGAAVGGIYLFRDWSLYHAGGGMARHPHLWGRISHESIRLQLWEVAKNMFTDHPLLGVGTGRFTQFFDSYALAAGVDPRLLPKVNAHSWFAQTAAEQGVFGLVSLGLVVLFVIVTLYAALAGKKNEQVSGSLPLLITAAILMVILAHGTANHIFHVRSMQCAFWLFAGLATLYVPPHWFNIPFQRKALLLFIGLIALAAVAKLSAIDATARQEFPQMRFGFHGAETLPNGGKVAWTRKRAADKLEVRGGGGCLAVSAPLPGLDSRPQQSVITLGDQTESITLNEGSWHIIYFKDPGVEQGFAPVRIENKWTFNPKDAGVSSDARDLGLYVHLLTRDECLKTSVR